MEAGTAAESFIESSSKMFEEEAMGAGSRGSSATAVTSWPACAMAGSASPTTLRDNVRVTGMVGISALRTDFLLDSKGPLIAHFGNASVLIGMSMTMDAHGLEGISAIGMRRVANPAFPVEVAFTRTAIAARRGRKERFALVAIKVLCMLSVRFLNIIGRVVMGRGVKGSGTGSGAHRRRAADATSAWTIARRGAWNRRGPLWTAVQRGIAEAAILKVLMMLMILLALPRARNQAAKEEIATDAEARRTGNACRRVARPTALGRQRPPAARRGSTRLTVTLEHALPSRGLSRTLLTLMRPRAGSPTARADGADDYLAQQPTSTKGRLRQGASETQECVPPRPSMNGLTDARRTCRSSTARAACQPSDAARPTRCTARRRWLVLPSAVSVLPSAATTTCSPPTCFLFQAAGGLRLRALAGGVGLEGSNALA